jgi:hypothetical protein
MISLFNVRCSALSSAVANPFALKIVLDLYVVALLPCGPFLMPRTHCSRVL